MKIQILPIRFGFPSPTSVPKRSRDFYARIAPIFFHSQPGINVTNLNQAEVVCEATVPIISEHSLSYESFADILITAVRKSDAKQILIDLGGADEKDIPRYNILVGLVLAINKLLSADANTVFGILLSLPLAEEDLVAPSLRKVAESDRVRLLFGNGEAWGTYFERTPPPEASVRAWVGHARADPFDALAKKLIRRIGQYSFPGPRRVIRHFYDGQKAFNEIYDIVGLFLEATKKSTVVRRIYYEAENSQWFRAPVEAVLRDTDMLRISEEITLNTRLDGTFGSDVVILLPIVRTGQTLRGLLSSLEQGVEVAPRPTIWSLLSTEGQGPRQGHRQIPLRGDGPDARFVSVEYALLVDPGDSAAAVSCWQDAPIDAVNPSQEDLGSLLTADAMWGMVLEAGMTPETPVPERRRSIGYVPDFGRLASLNGPFIAAKVEALLDRTFGTSLAQSLAFLAPDEEKARNLAESLRDLAGHDTVHVKREIIEHCRGGINIVKIKDLLEADMRDAFDQVLAKLSSWKVLVTKLPVGDRPQIILLDEFDYSGGTFEGLYNLAVHFNLQVICSVSIARFGGPKEDMPRMRALSLYDINYKIA